MKRSLFIPLIGPLILLFIWHLIHIYNIIDLFLLPDSFDVVSKLFTIKFLSVIQSDIISTLTKTLIAFFIAAFFGLPLGLLLGLEEKIYRSIELVIDFCRSTPPTAIFPVFLLFFGISDGSKIAAAVFGGLSIIIFNTAYGVIQSSKARRRYAYLLGATRWQVFTQIIIWESLSQTFTGLRNAVSMILVVIIVTEMFIGSNNGLGRRIYDFQITYDLPLMYAVIVITGSIGFILNFVFSVAEKHLIHWNRK